MFGAGRMTTLPTPSEALPGRDEKMPVPKKHFVNGNPLQAPFPDSMEEALFGLGCFWGAERKFWETPGVYTTAVGYAGGITPNPDYKEVCTGMTGHVEVAQITFDPATISFDELLNMFWQSHDPTTRNRQGNDVGTQYRSAIFYHNEEQRSAAEGSKEKFDNSEIFSNQIVTEIIALDQFWPAEDYHNNYYNNNPNQPYCRSVIKPKLDKLFKKK